VLSTGGGNHNKNDLKIIMLNMSFRARLDLSSTQRRVIDSMFAGPITVLRCLTVYNKTVKTPQDASIFLLLHRTDILPYIVGNRDTALEMLKDLVVHLANNAPKHLTLNLSHWSISPEGTVTLPSLGLRDVWIDEHCDRNELLQIDGPCSASLEHDGTDIVFCVSYQKSLSFVAPNRAVPRKKGQIKVTKAAKAALPKASIASSKRCPICHEPLLPHHWKQHANLLSQIVLDERPRVNAADIGLGSGGSIWAVSGGLPSLGKRAR